MTSFFANPWGLLALLGVPIVLAIHFLQRKTRRFPVSTLFLLDIHRRDSHSGRAIRRLVPSLPMWLQLLMVLLLALLLAQPTLPWQQKTQRVAFVIDSSASMSAFKLDLLQGIRRFASDELSANIPTEWLFLPADPTLPRIYAGNSLNDALDALEKWTPDGGTIDPSQSLLVARNRISNDGLVVFATDTPTEKLPANALLLAIGRHLDNVGITGIRITKENASNLFNALIINRSKTPQTRTWFLEWDGRGKSPEQSLTLEAGQWLTVTGKVPTDARRLRLVLSPDAFPMDDAFPFVVPSQRPLLFRATLPPSLEHFSQLLKRGVPALIAPEAGQSPNLVLTASMDAALPTSANAIVMNASEIPNAAYREAPILRTKHPFNEGLNWNGLAFKDCQYIPSLETDTPLVWCGDLPAISLREITTPGTPTVQFLIFHFNPAQSNLERLPASAILMLRFAESLRLNVAATAWEQWDTSQQLTYLLPESNDPLTLQSLSADGSTISSKPLLPDNRAEWRAPSAPGFCTIKMGDIILTEAALAFADAREGNFSQCSSSDFPEIPMAMQPNATVSSGPWRIPIIFALLLLLIGSWWLLGSDRRNTPTHA